MSVSEPEPSVAPRCAPIQATPVPSRPFTPPPVREPAPHYATRLLTGREQQFLTLIAEGRSYQEIANALKLSIHTVGCYRGRLLDRFQLSMTGELIAYAREDCQANGRDQTGPDQGRSYTTHAALSARSGRGDETGGM